MKILLVEDDRATADLLYESLGDREHDVTVALNGDDGLQVALNQSFDVILLDVRLPAIDGLGVCRRLRASGSDVPILLISAFTSTQERVMGLDAGADDFIAKPIDLLELYARLRVWERRRHNRLPSKLAWGALCVDTHTGDVTYSGQAVTLTKKEYELLVLLVQEGRRLIDRDRIRHLWGESGRDRPTDYTIKAHIQSLRKKLKGAGAPRDFIETVYALGYRLNERYELLRP